MRHERALVLAVWDDVRKGRWELLDMEPPGPLKARIVRPLLISRMTRTLRLASDGVIAAQKPLWEALPDMRQLERRVERGQAGSVWEAPVAQELPGPLALLPAYECGTEAYAECEGVLGSMRVALALRRYKADRGQPASRLEDLVPDYISPIPPDPFTGAELLLKRDGALLTVYSVGADLKDDGGKVEGAPEHHEPPDTGVRISE